MFNGGIDEEHKPVRILSTSKPGPSQGTNYGCTAFSVKIGVFGCQFNAL